MELKTLALALIEANILVPLVNLLKNAEYDIKKGAALAISNATSCGSEGLIKFLGKHECIRSFCDLLVCPDPKSLGTLVNLLRNAEFDIKKEAALAILNATSSGSPELIKFLVRLGCLQPLCHLLTCTEHQTIAVRLECLDRILKIGASEAVNLFAETIDHEEGLVKIKNLQYHDDHEIQKKAVKILGTYWLAG